jgi:hypothetical protein
MASWLYGHDMDIFRPLVWSGAGELHSMTRPIMFDGKVSGAAHYLHANLACSVDYPDQVMLLLLTHAITRVLPFLQ